MKACSEGEHNFKNSSVSAEFVLPGITPKLETLKFGAPANSVPKNKKYE